MDRRVEQEKKERYAQALREQLDSGQCGMTPIAGPAESSWNTADKVSQVQELMRQRIQVLHEEQQRMWQRVQAALAEQEGNAAAAAEKAASRCVEAAVSRSVETAVSRGLEGALAAARKECEALVKCSMEGVSGELGGLRRTVESLHAGVDGYAAALADHERRITRLEQGQEEWTRDREDILREQGAVADRMKDLQGRMEDVARKAAEIDRVATAQKECARHLADLQSDHREVGKELERLRNAQSEMAQQVAELPRLLQKLQRLEEEMPSLAARAAREALERARPAEPTPVRPPSPPSPPATKVSAAALAIFKNEDDVYELRGLTNVVGRGSACDACIPGSQAISNQHASVDFDNEGRTSLRDLGSRNGTFLNDRRVPQDDRGFILQSGDFVKLGIDGPVFLFEYGPAAYARWPQNLQRASGIRPLTGAASPVPASGELGGCVERRRPATSAPHHSPPPVGRGGR